jgi:hypothetical protein
MERLDNEYSQNHHGVVKQRVRALEGEYYQPLIRAVARNSDVEVFSEWYTLEALEDEKPHRQGCLKPSYQVNKKLVYAADTEDTAVEN